MQAPNSPASPASNNNNPNPAPASPPVQPEPAPQPQAQAFPPGFQEVGTHPLTDGEIVLMQEIYAAQDRLRTIVAMYLANKFGYPEKEPIAFNFDWPNKRVIAGRPSNFEVASGTPPSPAQDKAA